MKRFHGLSFFVGADLLALGASPAPAKPHPHLDSALRSLAIQATPLPTTTAAAQAGWKMRDAGDTFLAERVGPHGQHSFELFTDGGTPHLRVMVAPAHPAHPRLAWLVFDSGSAGTKGQTLIIRGALLDQTTGKFYGDAMLATQPDRASAKAEFATLSWQSDHVVVTLGSDAQKILFR